MAQAKTKFINAFSAYPQYADDIIYFTGKYGNDFLSAFYRNSQNGERFLSILKDNADFADDWVAFASKNDITSVKNIDIRDAITKQDLTELDDVDFINKVIYEDKNATRLYMPNPDVPQTESAWAETQIWKKGKKRLDALSMKSNEIFAFFTNEEGNVEKCNYLVRETQAIEVYVFRINADTPELRIAVENVLERLRRDYPKYKFSAIYGYGGL